MADLTKSHELGERVHTLIPAGAHTYSKGQDQFPSNAPRFIDSGKGAYVRDIDGNKYLDWGMGLRSVILGHAYPRVVKAAQEQLKKGSNFILPNPIEYELAELLHKTIPTAEMVKFAKNGSDVNNAAIRLSRAYTKRDKIAYCKDHPFYSVEDWFIGTTACNAGVPKAVQDLSVPFRYNDIESLKQLLEQNQDQVACVIMEAATAEEPKDNFLQKARDLAHTHGAVFILDEIITGFRYHAAGAQTHFNVKPDLTTFGKAIANGFSVSALVGKAEIMERGGLKHDKERVFLLSTTHGGETHAIAAAIATISEINEKNVSKRLWDTGGKLQQIVNELAKANGIERFIYAGGFGCSPVIFFKDENGETSLPLRTLFLQEMVRNGVLIPYVAPSFSHGEKELEKTKNAVAKALTVCKKAIQENNISKYLEGPVVKPVFRKYN